jgi:hypothetical protein
MELYTRSYPGLALQLAHYFGITLPELPHSTLNEALTINHGASLGTNELPRVSYVAIGNGGHITRTGINSFPLLDNFIHRSRDTGLFNQMPHILRPIGNDLTDDEREEFAMRRIENHNGEDYFAYYLRRFDKSMLDISIQDRTIDQNQNTQIDLFIPSTDDLKPEPIDLQNTGTNTVQGKYIAATVNLVMPFSQFHAEEFLNVCQIIYGDEKYAIISEIALVSGVDRMLPTSDGAGGTLTMNEAIHAQIVNQIPALQPVFSQRNGFEITAEVGGIEPLLNISP